MEQPHITISTLILTIVLSAIVTADPKCSIYKDNAICTIEDSDGDYVLKRGLVSDKVQLAYILLRSCKITKMEVDAFKNFTKLTYLDLSNNMISVLTPHVLDDSKHIRLVNLSRNQISQLGPDFFQPNIKVLDLSTNLLKDIPLGFFAVVSDIQYLYLANNQLTSTDFHYLTFQTNNLMVHFDISGNDINGLHKDFFMWAKSLEVLIMDRCSLRSAANMTSYLHTLKHLSMSFNVLTSIESFDIFVTLLNLEILDLSHNQIKYIDQNAFPANDKLKSINLRYNQLRTFDENVFRGMPMLGNLDLAHNLIEHVSASAFRETPLRNLNLASNRLTYLPDNFCLELRNSKTRLEKFYFNDNPWQCKCLHDIIREVKKYEIEYNSVKYDGEQPVCVTSKAYNCLRQSSANVLFTRLFDAAVDNYALNNLNYG